MSAWYISPGRFPWGGGNVFGINDEGACAVALSDDGKNVQRHEPCGKLRALHWPPLAILPTHYATHAANVCWTLAPVGEIGYTFAMRGVPIYVRDALYLIDVK